MPPPPHPAVAQVRKRLAYLIARSEHTQRDLERQLGLNKGHLSQILGGTIELKLWHVEALLDGLGIEASDFYAEMFPHPRHTPWGLAPEHEAELAAQGKLLPLLLATLFGFGIETLEAEHRQIEQLEDRLLDLAREQEVDVKP